MDTVLILDSDRVSRRRMVSAIRYGGFQAESAGSLQEACRMVRRHRYVALVVDPGDGVDSPLPVEELRARTDAHIIAVSPRDEARCRIGVLDSGADDVVSRAVDPEELLARIRAVTRRLARPDDDRPIVTADFTMSLSDRRLLRADGTEVTMSPTEWRLVEVLAQHAGHLVTREELLVSVWGPQAASKTQYLRVHMSSIRQKVEPKPSRPRYFVTVPGLGVRFDVDGGGTSADAERLTSTG